MSARLIVSATAPFLLAVAMGPLGVSWSLVIVATCGGPAFRTFRAIDHHAGRM